MTRILECTLDNDTTVHVPIHGDTPSDRGLFRNLALAWTEADKRGAQVLSDEQRGQALALQCRCALITASIHSMAAKLLPSLIAALVAQGEWTPSEGLGWAAHIPDVQRRAEAIVQLTPLLPLNLRRRAVEVVRAIGNDPVPRIPLPGNHTALEPAEIQERVQRLAEASAAHSRDALRTQTLARLAAVLGEPEQSAVVQTVVNAVLSYEYYGWRTATLDYVTPFLDEAQIREALRSAQELPTSHPALVGRNPRADTLVALVPRLAALGYTEEALGITRSMLPAREQAAATLAGIARVLPPDKRLTVLTEARRVAVSMVPSVSRDLALARIAVQYAEFGMCTESEPTIAMIERRGYQTWARAHSIQYLPRSLAVEALARVRASIPHWQEMPGDRDRRFEIFVCLAIGLARFDQVADAMSYVIEAHTSALYWRDRDAVLATLVPEFVALGYGREILETVESLELDYQRFEALSSLSRYLPAPLSRAALSALGSAFRGIHDVEMQARTLTHFAELLPLPARLWVMDTVLGFTPGEWASWDDEGGAWIDALQSLTKLANQLPAPWNESILQAVSGAVHVFATNSGETWLLDEWSELKSWQDGSSQGTAVDQSPPSDHVPDLLALNEALRRARAVEGYGSRERALAPLVPHLGTLPVGQMYDLWCETLHALAQRSRDDILSDLALLTPVLLALGGETALTETAEAIIEVGRWFS